MSYESKKKSGYTAFDLVFLTVMLAFVRVINYLVDGNLLSLLSIILVWVIIILIYKTKLPRIALQQKVHNFVFYSYAVIVFVIATTYF